MYSEGSATELSRTSRMDLSVDTLLYPAVFALLLSQPLHADSMVMAEPSLVFWGLQAAGSADAAECARSSSADAQGPHAHP